MINMPKTFSKEFGSYECTWISLEKFDLYFYIIFFKAQEE